MNGAGLVDGSPLTGLSGMTGSPAAMSAAESAMTGAAGNAHGAAQGTSLQSVLNGAAGLAGHDQALKKQVRYHLYRHALQHEDVALSSPVRESVALRRHEGN